MNYTDIRQNEKQFLALTGRTIEEFDAILVDFNGAFEHFIERYTLDNQPRTRKYSPRNERHIPTIEDKLFFILVYQKNNHLQEMQAAIFEMEQPLANRWIHILSDILLKSLEKYQAKKRIDQVKFEENQTYLIDATERPIQRDTYLQEDFYSGKKKTHTVKNLAIVNTLALVVFLGPTVSGKVADKTSAIDVNVASQVQADLYADLAFIGWKPKGFNLILPHKKPKKSKKNNPQLSPQQKQENKGQASIRVKVEHAFGSIKIMRIVKEENRNYKLGYRDLVMKTAVALHNLRIMKKYKIESI